MTRFRSALILFGAGLDRGQFLDDSLRKATLDRGIDTICSNVAGIKLVASSSIACTASVSGSAEAIDRLKRFVDDHRLGAVEVGVVERPALRGC